MYMLRILRSLDLILTDNYLSYFYFAKRKLKKIALIYEEK